MSYGTVWLVSPVRRRIDEPSVTLGMQAGTARCAPMSSGSALNSEACRDLEVRADVIQVGLEMFLTVTQEGYENLIDPDFGVFLNHRWVDPVAH